MSPQPPAPVALSCGEPAGVGPELAAKAWNVLRERVPFFLIGDARHLPADMPHVRITDPAEAPGAMAHGLPVLHRDFGPAVTPGVAQAAHAQPVIDAIAEGVSMAMSGRAAALCTAPIHKKALADGAGFAYPGHTEFLAALAGVDRVVMMLASPVLRVVPVTIHIPLVEVASALTPQLLQDTIRITHRGLIQRFALSSPRMAIAGLNPHAGEGGRMGREEIEVIEPVLAQLRAEGIEVVGPMSADTMFHDAARGRYDVAICMYHDQALIPIKTLDFDRGVNVTLGLPFLRTSPDHGTAFDIAGRGIANPTSIIAALEMAGGH